MERTGDTALSAFDRSVVGIDIGKTKVTVGLLSEQGKIIRIREQATNMHVGGPAIIKQCQEMIREEVRGGMSMPEAIGIAAPGIIDREAGVIIRSGSIPNWSNIPIRRIFEDEFRLPVAVDNDVYAAALGEVRFGAARGVPTAVYLSIGPGVGAATVRDGRVWRGSHGLAGQIAYVPLLGLDRTVNESFSGQGIARRASSVTRQSLGTRDVFQRAREGDERAASVVDEAVAGAALAVAWLQQTIDPDMFVLGGSVALEQPEFVEQVRERAHGLLSHYLTQVPGGLTIVSGAFRKHSGVVGAGALAFDVVAAPVRA